MAVLQDININVYAQPSDKRLRTFLSLSQNENGRLINFRILGSPLPSNCTAVFSGTKPDGNVYSKAGTVAGNFVIVQEDIQMTAVAGVWDAKLDIINGSHNIMTAMIRVMVERGTVAPGSVPSNSQLDGYVAQCKSYAEHARTDAYGSPLTATTAAEMTDKTRVYVYTGSESGMTAGNWYTWNGSAWVSGGVYNAVAVQTDTTLSVAGKAADAKETGDQISAVKEDLNDISDALSYSVTEDIYNTLTFTSGYMGPDGWIGTASTLQYSNKIPVKTGDAFNFTATGTSNFRFVTAFSGDSAVADSGAENTSTYTVPEGIDGIVVTIYSTSTNVKIEHTHKVLVDVVSMKSDVDTLNTDVDTLKTDVDVLKTDVDVLKTDVDVLKTDVDEALLYTRGYYNNTTLQYWNQTAQSIVYFKCRPNAEYTINKNIETPVFQICYIKEEPEIGVTQPIYNHTTPTGNTDITYTTGDDALYVLMLCGNYTGDRDTLISEISVTSEQILLEDDEARTIITYDEAYLPKHMYMIINKDYEIYHSQICPKAENYTFKWNSGSNYGNRVRVKYDSTGDKTLQCTIYNADGTLAKQLSTTVHVVNVASGNIHLLPFGDSLTNHCVWESELMNMAENIVCVGSRSRSIKDSDEETRTVYDEGRAGFSSFSYTTGLRYAYGSDAGGDELPHNRWYDPTAEKFSTDYYFENHFPSDQTAPDVITFFLGMNDLVGIRTVDEIVANIKSMIDNILSYNNTLKIVLIAPQLRYLPTLDGAEQLRFTDFAKAMEALARTYSNMVYLPLLVGMDSTNNYKMVSVTINTRNPKTEEIASDITHPAYVGYWQIADYVLGAISYLFN